MLVLSFLCFDYVGPKTEEREYEEGEVDEEEQEEAEDEAEDDETKGARMGQRRRRRRRRQRRRSCGGERGCLQVKEFSNLTTYPQRRSKETSILDKGTFRMF